MRAILLLTILSLALIMLTKDILGQTKPFSATTVFPPLRPNHGANYGIENEKPPQ